jgi:hypothetical protein
MSTLHLLPTWLVPEARWQRTGILSCRAVHSRDRVNTMAKNKYLFQEYSPQPLAIRGKKINCNKTDKLLIFNVVYARRLNTRTTHTHAAPGFRRVGEKQPFTSHQKSEHTSTVKNLLPTFTFTNSTPFPPYTNMLHWNTSWSKVTSFANTSRWYHKKLTTYCIQHTTQKSPTQNSAQLSRKQKNTKRQRGMM